MLLHGEIGGWVDGVWLIEVKTAVSASNWIKNFNCYPSGTLKNLYSVVGTKPLISLPDHPLEQPALKKPMQTYYYALASKRFLTEEEPLAEVLKERTRHYQEQEKEIDFWLVNQPAFLNAPEMATIKAKCPQPATAIISTNPQFIVWLKLRLEYVITGEFQAPSATISEPLASLASVSSGA